MVNRARTLYRGDIPQVVGFLERDSAANLGLLAGICGDNYDLGPQRRAWGYFRAGELIAVCQATSNIILSAAPIEALAAFADKLGRLRNVGAIVGPAISVLPLYTILRVQYGRHWLANRNVRAEQLLMVRIKPSKVKPDPNVRLLTQEDFASYYEASVHMYMHEIGVDPRSYGLSYANSVRHRLRTDMAYGVVRDGEVLFKADLGLVHQNRAQIQGVWLDPRLRGRGLATSAMTGMLALIEDRYSEVSLYVNEFNTAAIRTYQRCGFVQTGTFATVHL